jgi:hypothetical protein
MCLMMYRAATDLRRFCRPDVAATTGLIEAAETTHNPYALAFPLLG